MKLQMTDLKSENNPPPVVLVVDDNASVREAISELLNSVGIAVKRFPCAQDLLKQIGDSNDGEIRDANCLILDVRMPGMGGLELQHRLHTAHFNVPIIFISAHGDVRMTIDAMKAGALDFLSKPFRSQDMLNSVGTAIEYDHRRREIDRRKNELLVRYSTLTPRERSVLVFVAQGLLNKQIAWELGLAEITIKASRSHLMRKMKAKSVAELVKMEACLNDTTSNQGESTVSREDRQIIMGNFSLSEENRAEYS